MEYGPVGKLNYVYRIGKCAKPLQKALHVLSFILSPSGCYYFVFHKGLYRLLCISNSLQLKVLECQPLAAGVPISCYF